MRWEGLLPLMVAKPLRPKDPQRPTAAKGSSMEIERLG